VKKVLNVNDELPIRLNNPIMGVMARIVMGVAMGVVMGVVIMPTGLLYNYLRGAASMTRTNICVMSWYPAAMAAIVRADILLMS
jgi:hypothetical protein